MWPDGGYNNLTDGYTIYQYKFYDGTLSTLKSNATSASDFNDITINNGSTYYVWLSSNSTYDTSPYNYIHFILSLTYRSVYLYLNISSSRTTAPKSLSENTEFLFAKYPFGDDVDTTIPNTTWGVDISNLTINSNINFQIYVSANAVAAGYIKVWAILLSNESNSQTAYQNYLNSIGSSVETSFGSTASQYITYGESIT